VPSVFCFGDKEVVVVRGATTDGRLRYSVIRDGIVLGDMTNNVQVHIAPSPLEMRDPKSRITMTFNEGLRFVDDDVLPHSHHEYRLVVRHPWLPRVTYQVGLPMPVTVGQCR
jgi:hypothetical protein